LARRSQVNLWSNDAWPVYTAQVSCSQRRALLKVVGECGGVGLGTCGPSSTQCRERVGADAQGRVNIVSRERMQQKTLCVLVGPLCCRSCARRLARHRASLRTNERALAEWGSCQIVRTSLQRPAACTRLTDRSTSLQSKPPLLLACHCAANLFHHEVTGVMHEIVTLQFGSQSNYLGTHFWNTQVSTCNPLLE
jgi:hypothetical protein